MERENSLIFIINIVEVNRSLFVMLDDNYIFLTKRFLVQDLSKKQFNVYWIFLRDLMI